jgi:hypothetical protein
MACTLGEVVGWGCVAFVIGAPSAAHLAAATMRMVEVLHGALVLQQTSALEVRLLLQFTMLCDAISAVTEFMVRVLYSRCAIAIHNVAGGEGRVYDPISSEGRVYVRLWW